jgi:hypothetical protein
VVPQDLSARGAEAWESGVAGETGAYVRDE